MRDELLSIIEKNSRIDLKELAILLGREETDVLNQIEELERQGVIKSEYIPRANNNFWYK